MENGEKLTATSNMVAGRGTGPIPLTLPHADAEHEGLAPVTRGIKLAAVGEGACAGRRAGEVSAGDAVRPQRRGLDP